MKRLKKNLSVFGILLLTAVMLFCSVPVVSAAEGCTHSYEVDRYSGLRVCTLCGELCGHESRSAGKCTACGAVCLTHDWSYTSSTSTCRICGKTCSDHSKLGLDFDCAYCGKELGVSNSFSSGDNRIYDGDLMMDDVHSVSFNFDFTVGTTSTKLNEKDTSRSDNIYYNTTDSASDGSDYYSLFTYITSEGNYPFASLWMDTAETKLYLVGSGTSENKICEIKPGYEYNFDIVFELKTGSFCVNVYSEGEKQGSLSTTTTSADSVTVSEFRFGEDYSAKYLHIQKISFDNIEFDHGFSNGVCRICGSECGHSYNIGGHCDFCGVFGNPITFNDGQNGGGNTVNTTNNPKPLTANAGYYSSTGYNQGWDFRDTEGILLGQDYVLNAKFTFNSYTYNSASKTGDTALIIFSDGEVKSDLWRFRISLYANNNKLEMASGVGSSNSGRITLELGKDYDIRIAVRSTPTATEGTYLQRAEISVNGELTWIREFNLTAEDGLSIRIGDHTPRRARVKYDIGNDFSIGFLDSTVKYIGVQEKEDADYASDEKFDLRFIFAIDDVYLENAGVKVEADVSQGATLEAVSGEYSSASDIVFDEISVSGNMCKPGVRGAGYGGHYLALAVTDIPLDTASTYTFTLTPYVTHHESEADYSDVAYKVTLSFNDDLTTKIEFAEIGVLDTNNIRILAIGNSFSIDATTYLWDILNAAGVEELIVGNAHIGGCSLDKHWEMAQSDEAAYTYTKYTASGKTNVTSSLIDMVTDEPWDIVTLQQVSSDSGMPETYTHLADMVEFVRENCPNKYVDIRFHMTWAYQQDSTHKSFVNYGSDQMTMYNAITDTVQDVVLKNESITRILPSGTAIQNLRTSYLGDNLTRDGYHLTLDVGRYTAALTWASAITGIAPADIEYIPDSYASIAGDLEAIHEAVENALSNSFEVTESSFKEKPTLTLEDHFVEVGLDINDYEAIDWEPALLYHWNSTSGTSMGKSDSMPQFIASKKFTKAELPAGTVIVVDEGYQYRPDGWQELDQKNSGTRPGNCAVYFTVIDEAWWEDYNYRAFNVSKIGSKDPATEADAEHFKIYVKK